MKKVMFSSQRSDWETPHGKIDFIKGRLKFGGSKNSAPFPSMIVVFSY